MNSNSRPETANGNVFSWAYLGCGGIAETTAKELLRSGRHRIAALWNRTASRAEAFAARYGGTVYGTVEEAICDPAVEGVYIATTPDRHPDLIRTCVAHRKPVLCEKPFAVNAAVSRSLLDEAKEAGVYLSEAMWTWHNPIAIGVRNWVKSGQVGEVKSVEFTYGYPLIRFAPDHRLRDPMRIGGALLDIGIYPVRYCHALFGMPKEISCRGTLQGGVDFNEEIELAYDGFRARIRVAIDRLLGERCVISGSRGRIVIPQPHGARRARLTAGNEVTLLRDRGDLYARQFTNVAEEIRQGRGEGVRVPAEGTIQVMEILDECRRQMGLVYPCEAGTDWDDTFMGKAQTAK